MASYPNRRPSGRAGSGSPEQRQALPAPAPARPRPTPGPAPRRKPGRPTPERPRRPPAPAPRPSPKPAPKPAPPFKVPGKPGRGPDRTPKLPYLDPVPQLGTTRSRWTPHAGLTALPKKLGGKIFNFAGGWVGIGFAILDWAHSQEYEIPAEWQAGSNWKLWTTCPDPSAPFPWYVCSRVYGLTNGPPSGYEAEGSVYCLGEQAGFPCDGTDPTIPATWTPPNPFVNRVAFYQVWHNPVTGADRAWFINSYRKEVASSDPITFIPPQSGEINSVFGPNVPVMPWWVPLLPNLAPVAQPYEAPAKPLNVPRPDPWSPESPDVGPRPAPKPVPDTVPFPGLEPYITPVPRPAPAPSVSIDPLAPGKPQPGTRPHVPRPPGPGEKESKSRLGPLASAAWHHVGGITEGVDLINDVYEALPKDLKIALYKKLGRQPTPQEKVEAIFANLSKVDIPQALLNYINSQLEDMVFGIAGGLLGQASKQRGGPIGYGAGPAL